jgi:hypothetical protein
MLFDAWSYLAENKNGILLRPLTVSGRALMPRENDLEGQQDQGGKHGGQAGMPRTSPAPDQGIVRDERGQEQPRDKDRAQRVSRQNKGNDPPGDKSNQG